MSLDEQEEAALKKLTEMIIERNRRSVMQAKAINDIVKNGPFTINQLVKASTSSHDQIKSDLAALSKFGLVETITKPEMSFALFKIRLDKAFRIEWLSRANERLLAAVGENDILINHLNPPASNLKIN